MVAADIVLLVDAGYQWGWIGHLRDRLVASGRSASLMHGAGSKPLGRGFDALELLESTLFGFGARRFATRATEPTGAHPDGVLVDVSGLDLQPPGGIALRFDGQSSYEAVVGCLMERRVPLVTLVQGDRVLASARPAVDDYTVLGRALEQFFAAVADLCFEGLTKPAGQVTAGPLSVDEGTSPRHAPASGGLLPFALRTVRNKIVDRIRSLTERPDHWRVGWRRTSGGGVWATRDLSGAAFSNIPDDGQRFYADPFPFVWNDRSYIFVEEYPYATGKGVISVIALDDERPVAVPIIEQPFHMSYPNVFEHEGVIYMIPETMGNGSIEIWRADAFPHRWSRVGTLLSGIEAVDTTLLMDQGAIWVFASIRVAGGSACYQLRVWKADTLFGPLVPVGPLLADSRQARPAGALRKVDGRWWRPAQDCSQVYGGAVVLCRIDSLDTTAGLVQTPVHRIGPPPGFIGLHTLNCSHDLEVIDLCGPAPKRPADQAA
jgi:hypothetical protein